MGTGGGRQWVKVNGNTDGCTRRGIGIYCESICTGELAFKVYVIVLQLEEKQFSELSRNPSNISGNLEVMSVLVNESH